MIDGGSVLSAPDLCNVVTEVFREGCIVAKPGPHQAGSRTGGVGDGQLKQVARGWGSQRLQSPLAGAGHKPGPARAPAPCCKMGKEPAKSNTLST